MHSSWCFQSHGVPEMREARCWNTFAFSLEQFTLSVTHRVSGEVPEGDSPPPIYQNRTHPQTLLGLKPRRCGIPYRDSASAGEHTEVRIKKIARFDRSDKNWNTFHTCKELMLGNPPNHRRGNLLRMRDIYLLTCVYMGICKDR